jgi:hypothetical protein
MANTFKWILQSSSTNKYLTSTGWSINIADAKSFDQPTDLDGLNNGDYILIPIWSIT